MKRLLLVLAFLSLAVTSIAFGASTRWNALGGEHRFIIDTTNYTIYPGRLTVFGNAVFVIPLPNFLDDNFVSGALVNVKDMTLAYHYNLDSDGIRNLRKALAGFKPAEGVLGEAQKDMAAEDAGTAEWIAAKKEYERISQRDRLGALDIKTVPDLFWGMKMGKISLGARLALAMDSTSDAASLVEKAMGSEEAPTGKITGLPEEMTTSAMAFDVALGATMYETPAGDLDLGVGIGMQSFSDDDPNSGLKVESTGGMDMAFNARLNKPLGKEKDYTLIPVLNVNVGSQPSTKYDVSSAPNVTEVSYTKGDAGVGIRKRVKEKGFVVVGALGGFGSTVSKPTMTVVKEGAAPEEKKGLETTDTNLVATILAGVEFPVNKWLVVRGGGNVKLSSVSDEMIVKEITEDYSGAGKESTSDVLGTRKTKNFSHYYNMGIRAIYNGVIVDVLLARNILHRGPYFLTGANGDWATHICVTYAF